MLPLAPSTRLLAEVSTRSCPMTALDQIQSPRVKACLTGSCTPAASVLRLDGLTVAEREEADAYFLLGGFGLVESAALERSAVISRDC